MTSNPGHLPSQTPNDKSYSWLPILEGLTEKTDWNRDLIEHSHDLLCIHNLEGRLLSVNPRPAQLLGYTVEELLRISMRDLIPLRFQSGFDEYLKTIVRDGEASGLFVVLTRTREERIWEFHNTLRTEGVPTPVVRGVAHDVTERIRIEKQLREGVRKLSKLASEQEIMLRALKLFRTLLDNSNDAIEVIDPQTMRFLDINQKACLDLGYSRDELLSMTLFDIDPEITPEILEARRQHLHKHKFLVVETMHRRKDGSLFPVEVNIRRVVLDKEYVVTVTRDITKRKVRAAALEESERRFRALYERAPVGIALVESHTGKFLQVNPKHCEIVGRTEQEMLQLRFQDITHPEDLRNSDDRLTQMIDEKLSGYDLQKRYLRPDGRVVWVNLSIVPMWEPGEQLRWHMAIVQDITEHRMAEEALRESEERMRLAQQAAGIGVFERNMQQGGSQWTPEMEAIFGLPAGEAPKTVSGLMQLVHPEDREPLQRLIDHSAQNGTAAGEWRVIWPDGSVHWISGRWRMFTDMEGRPLRAVGVDIDITEQKRAEEALRESEERMRLAQEVARIGTFDRNLVTNEHRWTPQMEAMYGLPPGGAPRSIEQFLELIHPNDRKRISELVDRSMQAGEGHGEWRVVWPDGTVRWIAGRWRVFKDANGKPVRAIGIDYDITDRKRIEHELRVAKEKLTEEKLYLEHEINTEFGFEEIVGKSRALKDVMESASRVASSDATVLLLGETGTGKELIARAIHRLSQRSRNAFIKMNCAAIPSGLLESELFGAEKGAFTGATSRKIGRLELADKGTMFLDEIGEIALSLQPKLLRVLQDQEFERLGGTRTIKVDFRLIAATNRDLTEQVRDNLFRRDLYYRLNVFPIHLPPLRERRDDIPLLVEHFVQKCAQRMGKSITSIPKKTMDTLTAWHWPGNVRELENFVERSVILTNGSVLTAPLSELQASIATGDKKSETLEAAERRYILEALRKSNGRISGINGAAARLGLKRTTLQSKLKQMGINPRTPPTS
jgi:formate hydrogenlyase transcriptional activator